MDPTTSQGFALWVRGVRIARLEQEVLAHEQETADLRERIRQMKEEAASSYVGFDEDPIDVLPKEDS